MAADEAGTVARLRARRTGIVEDITTAFARKSVVGAIEPNLQQAEVARATAKPTGKLDAYDLYLQALQQIFLLSETFNLEVMRLLHQANAMDPNFALANAAVAACRITAHRPRRAGRRVRQ
jgi:hypothetical protein